MKRRFKLRLMTRRATSVRPYLGLDVVLEETVEGNDAGRAEARGGDRAVDRRAGPHTAITW